MYLHLITSQGKWQTSALIRQLVNSDSLEQHRDLYTRLISEEVDPDEDQLDAADRCALARGEDVEDPRDIFGLLEVVRPSTSEGSDEVFNPKIGTLMHIKLPADTEDGNFVPLEDEYSLTELEQRAALYLRRRFALRCDHKRACLGDALTETPAAVHTSPPGQAATV